VGLYGSTFTGNNFMGIKVMADLKDYNELLNEKMEKFSPEQVDYRDAVGKERCGRCIHYFERKIDRYGICELVRLEDEDPVSPDYTCDFWTPDGENFPLLKKKSR
jgi:hypothetical protein